MLLSRAVLFCLTSIVSCGTRCAQTVLAKALLARQNNRARQGIQITTQGAEICYNYSVNQRERETV